MVKVKADAAGEAAVKKVSGKKKKDEKKILKVVSNRNGASQPSFSLKTKNKKKKNKRKKNKINSNNGTENETPLEINAAEPSPVVGDSNTEPQESNTEKRKKNKDGNLNDVPASDVSSSTEKEEPGTTPTEKTDSEGKQESDTQGKKKKKKKRKASEAIEGTEGITESTDKTDQQKGAKRMKVEEKEEGDNNAEREKAKSKKTKKKEKKYVLFIGNLPFEVTEDEIRKHFKVAGDSIVRVTLQCGRKTDKGKGKGYGFIEFSDVKGYENALKLNLSQLKDRKINVEFTTPGKNTKKRKSFIKIKTKKLLGQKKGNKGKKKRGNRKH